MSAALLAAFASRTCVYVERLFGSVSACTPLYISVRTYPGFAQGSDASQALWNSPVLEMLHCFVWQYFFISDELQDVYRCLLVFNLYNGGAGCLWLVSAEELHTLLGAVLALLKSLAQLPLISLRPRGIPLWICCLLAVFLLWWFWFNEWNVFILGWGFFSSPMWNLQLLFGFFYRTYKLQQEWT